MPLRRVEELETFVSTRTSISAALCRHPCDPGNAQRGFHDRSPPLAHPLCAALLLSPAVLHAQTAAASAAGRRPARPVEPGVQAIRALEERRFAASPAATPRRFAVILSDDLTYTHSSGQLETKGQFLESIRSGAIQYTAILPESLDVRLYGDTAVVTGKGTFDVRMQGRDLQPAAPFHRRLRAARRRLADGGLAVHPPARALIAKP